MQKKIQECIQNYKNTLSWVKDTKHPQWIEGIKSIPQWIKSHQGSSPVSLDHQPKP